MIPDDPAARYKALLGAAHTAARAHGEHERERAVALVREIADARKRVTETTKAESDVAEEVVEWWREVIGRITGLKWIASGRRPAPDPSARPELLEQYLAEVEPATERFHEALRRASWRRRPG